MNKTFEWTRFGKVLRKDLRNIWRNVGITLLIIALLPSAMWLCWWMIGGEDEIGAIPAEVRWFMVYVVGVLAAVMAPSRMYRNCNVPKKGIYFAMLPASKLEKYLSMLIVAVVVCPLLCMMGSVVIDIIEWMVPVDVYRQPLWEKMSWADYAFDAEDMAVMRHFWTPGTILLLTIISLLSNSSTFFFTTTIFKKHKVLYTILWLWLISFVLQFVGTVLFFLTGSGDLVNCMEPFMLGKSPDEAIGSIYLVSEIVMMLYTVGLFVWSYFRLKKMRY